MATKREDLLYPELSFRIVGVCFDVFRQLGPGHKEEQYQRALAVGFDRVGMKYRQQVSGRLEYEGKRVGLYRMDFVVEDKIVVEIKALERFRHDNYRQLKTYLSQSGLNLGLLVRFSDDGATYQRVLKPFR